MKAFRRQKKEARAAAIETVDRPACGPNQVLIKVDYCGICGSDLHSFLNHAGYESVLEQVTFGHEFSGEVVEVGSDVSGWEAGQFGTMIAIQGCLKDDCDFCKTGLTQLCPERKVQGLHLDGGMAEYVAVDHNYVIHLPEGIDMKAAALTEPLSVAVHCIENRSPIKSGDNVVVTGPGIIGMFCAVVARNQGANVVLAGTESDEAVRLSAGRTIGFTTCIVGADKAPLNEQIAEHFGGREADVLVEASGAPIALATAAASVRANGTIAVVAIYGSDVTLTPTAWIRKQLLVQTSYGSALPSYERAIELLHTGVVPADELVKIYPLDDAAQAFTDSANQAVMKPVLACQPTA